MQFNINHSLGNYCNKTRNSSFPCVLQRVLLQPRNYRLLSEYQLYVLCYWWITIQSRFVMRGSHSYKQLFLRSHINICKPAFHFEVPFSKGIPSLSFLSAMTNQFIAAKKQIVANSVLCAPPTSNEQESCAPSHESLRFHKLPFPRLYSTSRIRFIQVYKANSL